jgi:protease-4
MNISRDLILIAARALAALLVLLIVSYVVGKSFNRWWNDNGPPTPNYQSANGGTCNIAVVPLQGSIEAFAPLPNECNYVTTTGDSVVSAIKAAEADGSIKGIMLQIDSSGGSPAASEQMMKAIQRVKLPTLAYIREVGTSGGYLAATGANTIIASNYADVGSIGITESYVQQTVQDTKNGLQYIQLSSGPFKDMFNPSYPITPTQRTLAQRDIDLLAQVFIGEVAQNRKMATSTVAALADGSSMSASLALKNGLIDQIGDEETARAWFTQKAGEDAILCAAPSH